MITRFSTPRVIERGRDTTLTMPVYSDAGVIVTPTVGTFALYDGSEEVVAPVAVTSLGPPPSYSLAAAVTTSRGLSDQLLEVWTLTIDGVPTVFRRTAYLVRHAYHSHVLDADLVKLHANLLTLRPAGFESQRVDAREQIERDLIKRGQRPALIFDSWALYDAERYLALSLIYTDFASSLSASDGRYLQLAEQYRERYESEMAGVKFRTDEGETGTVDHRTSQSAYVPVVLSSGVPRSRMRWRGL